MAAAAGLLTGLPGVWFVPAFTAAILLLLIFASYEHMTRVLKWLTLALFSYVFAAMLSGVAAVILVVAAFRKVYGLQEFITGKHFRYLSYLLIALGVGYLYFMVSEYLTEAYVLEQSTTPVLEAIFQGVYAPAFWTFTAIGLVFPLVLAALPGRFPIARACTASALVIGGRRWSMITAWARRLAWVPSPGSLTTKG